MEAAVGPGPASFLTFPHRFAIAADDTTPMSPMIAIVIWVRALESAILGTGRFSIASYFKVSPKSSHSKAFT
jgi:hypothetical protein